MIGYRLIVVFEGIELVMGVGAYAKSHMGYIRTDQNVAR